MNMEDHRHEDYAPPPKPKLQAFSGAGHKLGRLDVQIAHVENCLINALTPETLKPPVLGVATCSTCDIITFYIKR